MTDAEGATALLTLAAAVSDGHHRLPGMSQTRAVCLITRQALEQVVDDLLAERELSCPAASMRARPICLAAAYEYHPEDVAHRAANAWGRLSAACHHHAYELSPTAGEARALVDEVAWLSDQSKRHPGVEQ